MIRKLLILFAAATIGRCEAATRSELPTLVNEAQAAYAAGDHAKALALFDSVRTTHTSTALLFNIGNCHYKLGDIPRAILFYERALRLSPGDEDVLANLAIAEQQVVDRVNQLPSFTLGTTWGRIRGGQDPDQWSRRSLFASLLFFLLLAAAFAVRKRGLKRSLLGAAGVGLVLLLLSIVFAVVRNAEIEDDSEAIILTPKVDVRSEPQSGGTVLFVLHKGTKVEVLDSLNEWYEVQLPNGSVGWMPSTTLERI